MQSLNGSSSSPSVSLKQLLGSEIELIDFISFLTICPTKEVATIEALANKIQSLSKGDRILAAQNRPLIANLILRQFPKAGLDNVRELIANGMDANARAGRANDMVIIELAKGCLSIHDAGDGVGNLLNLFVPGLSANAETLFDPQAGQDNVTGRFGQGFLSAFYYLHTHIKAGRLAHKFHFKGPNGMLSFNCLIDGQMQKVHIEASQEDLVFRHSTTPLISGAGRKMTVHTRRKNCAIKMTFKENQGQIYVDMCYRPKDAEGTLIKIVSPYFVKNEPALLAHIENVFKSCVFPISLNATVINQLYTRQLPFKGGVLSFKPLDRTSSKGGMLRILECGKLILDFELSASHLVPSEVSIDFNRLCLSQERASLDYKDRQAMDAMHQLVQTISQSTAISILEKNALLNAIQPIAGAKHFNVQAQIQAFFTQAVQPAESCHLAIGAPACSVHYGDMHADYFSALAIAPTIDDGCIKLYVCQMAADLPVAFIEGEGKQHVFYRQQLWQVEKPTFFAYNLYMLALWMKNKGLDCSLDVPHLSALSAAVPPLQEEPLADAQDFSDIDWQKYANAPASISGGDRIGRSVYFLEWFPKYVYSTDAFLEEGMRGYLLNGFGYDAYLRWANRRTSSQAAIQHYRATKAARDMLQLEKIISLCINYIDSLRYLADAFFSGKKCFAHMATIEHPLFLKLIEEVFMHDAVEEEIGLKGLHFFIYTVHGFLKGRPADQQEHYFTFLLNTSSFSLKALEQAENVFLNFQQIIEYTGCKQKAVAGRLFAKLSTDWSEQTLASLKQIALKVAHQGSAFLEKIHALKHHAFLLALPKNELVHFLEVLPECTFLKELNEDDYCAIHLLSLKSHLPLAVVKQWIEIYSVGACISKNAADLSSTGFLLPLIHAYIADGMLSAAETLESVKLALQAFYLEACDMWCKGQSLIRLIGRVDVDQSKPLCDRLDACLTLVTDSEYRGFSYTPFDNLTLSESLAIADHLYRLKLLQKAAPLSAAHLAERAHLFRKLWEQCSLLNSLVRPFAYALTFKEKGCLLSEDFCWPQHWDSSAVLLQQDSDVLARYGSENVAKARIQSALKQSTEQYFFVKEICKNSLEAKATKISFEMHCDKEKNSILIIQDNGQGMDLEGLKTLKIPHASSKNQAGDDPNFGWGFFTIFRDFDEVVITSSKDGKSSFGLALMKTPAGLIRQYTDIKGPHFKGTRLLLKAKNDPLITLIKLEAELMSTCRFLTDIDISYQGLPLHQAKLPEVLHTEIEDDICLQLGKGEEGIYCKNMLVASLSSQLKSFLPQPLQSLLKELKLRIYLPHTKQVMNRSHLIMDETLQQQLQLLIARVLCNYCAKIWSCGGQKAFGMLSEDYWDNFTVQNTPASQAIDSLVNALQGKYLKLDSELALKCKLVVYAKALLTPQAGDQTDYNAKTLQALESLEQLLQKQAVAKGRKEALANLQSKFFDSSSFAAFFVHYPLNGRGQTFMSLRAKFKVFLTASGLLLKNGAYNIPYIKSQDIDQLLELIKSYASQLLQAEETACQSIILYMAEAIGERLTVMRTQKAKLLNMHSEWHEHVLQKFFTRLALKLGKEVEIEFYTSQDGLNAYTFQGGSRIFFNRYGQLSKFMQLCSTALPWQELPFIKLVTDMVETLAHELVHIEEGSDCHTTHDQAFRAKLALKLQTLFIDSEIETTSPLALLMEAVEESTEA